MPWVSRGRVSIVLATLFFHVLHAHAATITVDDASGGIGGPGCTLRDALSAANADAPSGGCSAGDGADTIDLPPGATIMLYGADNTTESGTGLPSITSPISINGHGSVIQRDPAAEEFRIFHVAPEGDLVLQELTVGNGLFESTRAFGAGILNRGTLTLDNCTIEDNESFAGGGITNLGGTVAIEKSTIRGNSAGSATGSGGGIWNTLGGTMTLADTTISDNISGGGGAGINNVAELILTRTTVSGNAAGGVGGGIANYARLTLTNSTLCGNSAMSAGGGLSSSGVETATLINNTIVDNTSTSYGGGVANMFGPIVLSNNIVAANSSRFGGPDFHGTGASEGSNLIGNGTSSSGFDETDDLVGTSGTPIDPMLEPLADNGGPTLTHVPMSGSPAIDAGDCADGIVMTDQRGIERPQPTGAACDIGAVELEGADSIAAPIALCQDVDIQADSDCTGDVSPDMVDNGSSVDEAHCGAATLSLDPPGPYPAGASVATLWVTDSCSQSESCDATITVIDDSNPSVDCPENIESDAIRPDGASVWMEPATADDNCPGPTVLCDAYSGGIFPIGTTVVTCTASDTSGNQAHCAFTVHVFSPEEMIENIVDDVDALRDSGRLNSGQANSLVKKASAILARLDRGQFKVACNQLKAFINEVRAMIAAGILPEAEGRQLIASASHARNALDCGRLSGGPVDHTPKPKNEQRPGKHGHSR